jgi:hypothetical protein
MRKLYDRQLLDSRFGVGGCIPLPPQYLCYTVVQTNRVVFVRSRLAYFRGANQCEGASVVQMNAKRGSPYPQPHNGRWVVRHEFGQ